MLEWVLGAHHWSSSLQNVSCGQDDLWGEGHHAWVPSDSHCYCLRGVRLTSSHITPRSAFPAVPLLPPFSSSSTLPRLSQSAPSSTTAGPALPCWPAHLGKQLLGRILIFHICWCLVGPLVSSLFSLFSSGSRILNSLSGHSLAFLPSLALHSTMPR